MNNRLGMVAGGGGGGGGGESWEELICYLSLRVCDFFFSRTGIAVGGCGFSQIGSPR